MKDIFTVISTNKVIFEDFRKWLFNKMNRNAENFRKLGASSTTFKLPYLIQYLEYKQVPILEALCYYNCLSSNLATNYDELVSFMVINEFKKLEQKKVINYTPF